MRSGEVNSLKSVWSPKRMISGEVRLTSKQENTVSPFVWEGNADTTHKFLNMFNNYCVLTNVAGICVNSILQCMECTLHNLRYEQYERRFLIWRLYQLCLFLKKIIVDDLIHLFWSCFISSLYTTWNYSCLNKSQTIFNICLWKYWHWEIGSKLQQTHINTMSLIKKKIPSQQQYFHCFWNILQLTLCLAISPETTQYISTVVIGIVP